MASNSVSGNKTSLPPDDLVHLNGPITEAVVLEVLKQRSAAAENYVGDKMETVTFNLFLFICI